MIIFIKKTYEEFIIGPPACCPRPYVLTGKDVGFKQSYVVVTEEWW